MVRIEQRNGELVGIDGSGNKIPIEFGEIDPNKIFVGDSLFVSNGAYISRSSTGVNATKSYTTTNTSWDTVSSDFMRWRIAWNTVIPSAAQSAAYSTITIDPGTGETVDVRLRNFEDGETILSKTGITSKTNAELGPANYTPSTTSSLILLAWEIQTSPGSNSSEIRQQWTSIGEQL